MATITFTIPDSNFAGGQPATGTDVTSRTNQLKTFLEGANLDSGNLSMAAAFPWTGRHTFTVSDASNDNMSLVIGAVMGAAKYGLHISSSQAQINSAMVYLELTNASSSVPCLELANAGTGSTYKATASSTGISYEGNNSSTSNTNPVFKATQAGTGALFSGTLRTLASLNAVCLSKAQTTVYTVSNSSTETVDTDLTVSLPANFLKVGTTIRGTVYGVITTPGAGPATAQLRVKYGGTGGTTLLDSSAITPTISLTNAPVKLDFTITCTAVGGSGTVEAQGLAFMNPSAAISATIGPAARGMGGSGAGSSAAVTIDTTTANDLVTTFTWGSAVVGCSFSFRAGHVEILK